MEGILMIIIVILLGIILIQHYQKVQKNKVINYITQKLEDILANDSIERIKVFTADTKVKALLSRINEVLDYNHKNKIRYHKTQLAIKKMISNISHDLKTPLTVILGYSEVLMLKGEEKVVAEKIYLKATEVLELINKFFDLAKLESKDKEFPITKVNVSEICRTSILDFYDTLYKKGIEVCIDIPDKNIVALGNEEAIHRILNNLISNAIQYGNAGAFLGLSLREEKESVIIDVIDKGKGIKEQYKEEVFERIFTLEDSRSKAYQGSGLGLTITKHLVEALGGEIHLNSIPNKKTVFSFVLNKPRY